MKLWAGMGVISAVLMAAFVAVPFVYQKDRAGGSARRIALGSKIRGLDPQDISDTTSAAVAAQLFETLYTYHYLKRPYELVPLLADGMPTTGPDELTWTIRIKPGVRFADDPAFGPGGRGRELVAADFVYAWKRLADLNNESPNYHSIFAGNVVGLDEFRDYTATASRVDYDRPVEGLQAIGRYAIRLRLTRPAHFLLHWLAHLPTAPVAREAVEHYGEEIVNHPVGTGPYVIVGDFRSNSFSTVRNPNFRGLAYPTTGEDSDQANGFLDDAGRPIPLIDRADWVVIEEDQPAWLAFMDGLTDSSGIPKDNFQQAITPGRELSPELSARGVRLLKFDNPSVYYFGLNMDDPVVGRLKPLRQAMSLAYDRQTFIDTFLNGRGRIAAGPIPPMLPGHRPERVNSYVRFDLARARELLAQAEREFGGPVPTLRLAYGGTDTTARQFGEFFQIQMAQIGLNVEVDFMTAPRLQDATRRRSHQVFALRWTADYPDAQNVLLLFYGKNRSPGPNASNYSNPEFDRLYEQAIALADLRQRIPLYHRMEDIVIEDCPWILGEYTFGYVLYHDWLHNYKPNQFAQGTLKYQRIDAARRRQWLERR